MDTYLRTTWASIVSTTAPRIEATKPAIANASNISGLAENGRTRTQPLGTCTMTDANRQAKSGIRASMRAMLAAMTDEQRHLGSAAACSRLCKLEVFHDAAVSMLYMPLPDEIDLTPVAIGCFQMGKTVCVPRVDWKRRDMIAVEATSFDDQFMEIDEHGLRVPREGRPVPTTMIDLVVVPGLTFDTQGHRLGRGGGFYDRFLSRLRRSATTIGLAFDGQIIDRVPVNDRDIAVEIIVTDRRTVHASGAG